MFKCVFLKKVIRAHQNQMGAHSLVFVSFLKKQAQCFSKLVPYGSHQRQFFLVKEFLLKYLGESFVRLLLTSLVCDVQDGKLHYFIFLLFLEYIQLWTIFFKVIPSVFLCW